MRRLLLLCAVSLAVLLPTLVAQAAPSGSDPAPVVGVVDETGPAGAHGKLGPHGKKGPCPFAADPAI